MKLIDLGANVSELQAGKVSILISYETPVAIRGERGICIKTSKKHSSTTSKHINKWFAAEIAKGCPPFTKPQSYFDNLLQEVK